ncbi:MAG: M14 metallopeptidase family protein [Bacteroidota bacterium]|nr:M14 metallopeptidase family protein [Bacteroidota bacterium]
MRKALFMMAMIFSITGLMAQNASFTKPAVFFGFEPGSDRNLFSYEQLIEYLQKLDGESDRIYLEEIGKSPMGRPMYIAFISSAENIARLKELKIINRELALNPNLNKEELQGMTRDGKVFILATLSMHSSEVAPSQSAPLIAFDYATTDDPKKVEWLNNVVYMMVPCHNPDGMNLIVENYLKYKGTKYEGASLPAVYHKYVGHDNNRDFVILSQEDTRAIARIYNQTWFPQVMVEKHQMGSTGTRYFVPPNHDPIAENVAAGVFHWGGVFGQHMATDMTAEGLAGVSQHYIFDDYWPGSTETCIWKNVIGFLTEAASVQTASPIYIEPTELRVGGKGLSEYKKSINMLLPWEGGWWRLGDIVQYEIASTTSIIKTASLYREDILEFRNRMCREQVELGKSEAPYYYIMPEEQHDQGELVNLVKLMKEHGVEVYTLNEQVVLKGKIYKAGDVVIPLAQPFRPFIKEVMEAQVFPERHYTPGGELIKPYDITSWSLPLHRFVTSNEIDTRSKELEGSLSLVEGDYSLKGEKPESTAMVLPATSNESFRAVFSALKDGMKVERLLEERDVAGHTYGAGSFIVYRGSKKEQWNELFESLPFQPGALLDKRALPTRAVEMPSIALVETWFHDMDAGWTRFLFDSYHMPFTVLHPGDFTKSDLAGNFDVIIFPDTDKEILKSGKRKSGGSYYQGSYHPDYVKGIGKEGMEKLMAFSNEGGIIISWGRSVRLFEGMLKIKTGDTEEEFSLPFRDISPDLKKGGLYIPGSLVKVKLIADHPLTLGMPESIGVFSRGRPVFTTSVPKFDMDRRVIGTYPEKDILLSGYASGEEKMGNRAAMIWMEKGQGQFVLFGFGPQFRASTQASYKLLFNAILLEGGD